MNRSGTGTIVSRSMVCDLADEYARLSSGNHDEKPEYNYDYCCRLFSLLHDSNVFTDAAIEAFHNRSDLHADALREITSSGDVRPLVGSWKLLLESQVSVPSSDATHCSIDRETFFRCDSLYPIITYMILVL